MGNAPGVDTNAQKENKACKTYYGRILNDPAPVLINESFLDDSKVYTYKPATRAYLCWGDEWDNASGRGFADHSGIEPPGMRSLLAVGFTVPEGEYIVGDIEISLQGRNQGWGHNLSTAGITTKTVIDGKFGPTVPVIHPALFGDSYDTWKKVSGRYTPTRRLVGGDEVWSATLCSMNRDHSISIADIAMKFTTRSLTPETTTTTAPPATTTAPPATTTAPPATTTAPPVTTTAAAVTTLGPRTSTGAPTPTTQPPFFGGAVSVVKETTSGPTAGYDPLVITGVVVASALLLGAGVYVVRNRSAPEEKQDVE